MRIAVVGDVHDNVCAVTGEFQEVTADAREHAVTCA